MLYEVITEQVREFGDVRVGLEIGALDIGVGDAAPAWFPIAVANTAVMGKPT